MVYQWFLSCRLSKSVNLCKTTSNQMFILFRQPPFQQKIDEIWWILFWRKKFFSGKILYETSSRDATFSCILWLPVRGVPPSTRSTPRSPCSCTRRRRRPPTWTYSWTLKNNNFYRKKKFYLIKISCFYKVVCHDLFLTHLILLNLNLI